MFCFCRRRERRLKWRVPRIICLSAVNGNLISSRHSTSWRHFERALTKWLTSKLAAPRARFEIMQWHAGNKVISPRLKSGKCSTPLLQIRIYISLCICAPGIFSLEAVGALMMHSTAAGPIKSEKRFAFGVVNCAREGPLAIVCRRRTDRAESKWGEKHVAIYGARSAPNLRLFKWDRRAIKSFQRTGPHGETLIWNCT